MNNKFIEQCKKTALNGFDAESKKSYESLILFLFRMKLRGKEKARQIDEYDGESLFGKNTLYPGQIYAFIYKAETPTTYDDGKLKFEYYDKLPIVLITHVEGKKVRGINLNLCNYALRTFIINALYNLDIQFFERDNLAMANNGKAPISNNVASVFLNSEKEKQFVQYIIKECKLLNTGILYRSYLTDKISDIRMIEIWQYKYIPFLTYTGEMKLEMLRLIWKVTGIDKIRQ